MATLVFLAVLASSCSGGSDSADQQASTASPSGTTSSAPPAGHSVIRKLRPVAKVTAACSLLSAAELKELLGGAAGTDVKATEDKPERPSGSRSYTCEYGSGGNNPFALNVLIAASAGGAFTPKAAIDAVAETAGVKTHIVHSVGQAAIFYAQKDSVSVLAAAKRSHGQVRMITFAAPKTVPGRKFIAVAKLVLSRI